ncbi:Flp family type IVb pilin [Vibrio sp. CDRSL-10 TSBA]
MFLFKDLTTKAWCSLISFLHCSKGASGIEYAIIATIAAVAIALFSTGGTDGDSIADRITAILDDVKSALPEADG